MIKKILSLALFLAFNHGFLNAQGPSSAYKGDELYATVNSIKDFDFGLAYKLGLTNNWYMRFDVLNASSSNKKLENTSYIDDEGELIDLTHQKNSNYGLGIGIEKRNEFNAHVEFLYGLSLIGRRTHQGTEGINADNETLSHIKQNAWSYGLGLNLGVLIKVANNLYVAGELMPQYLINKDRLEYYSDLSADTRVQKSSGNSFNFDLKDIRLSLVYRFRR